VDSDLHGIPQAANRAVGGLRNNMQTRAQAFWRGASRGGKMGAIVGITIVGIGACIVLTLAVLFPDLRKEMFADLKDQGVISAIGGCIFGFIVFVMYCAIPGAIILGVIESIRAAPIRFSYVGACQVAIGFTCLPFGG